MSKGTVLHEYLNQRNLAPFDCVEYNCCHFTCNWIERIEGVNPLPRFPHPILKTYREQRRQGITLTDMFAEHLQRDFTPNAFLTLGDVVTVVLRGKVQGAGICAGRNAVVLHRNGYAFFPMEHVLKGWRVGC